MFRNIAARWSGVNLLSSLESEKNEKKNNNNRGHKIDKDEISFADFGKVF